MNCKNKSKTYNIGQNLDAAMNHVLEAQRQEREYIIEEKGPADTILALEKLRQEIYSTMGIIGMEQMGQ